MAANQTGRGGAARGEASAPLQGARGELRAHAKEDTIRKRQMRVSWPTRTREAPVIRVRPNSTRRLDTSEIRLRS